MKCSCVLTVAALAGLLAGCGGDDEDGSSSTGGRSGTTGGAGGAGSERPGQLLLDESQIVQLDLTMRASDWDQLLANAGSDVKGEYVEATLTVGEASLNVGVRNKGNPSLATRTAGVISLKLDFDRFVPGQEFDGLVKVNLHGPDDDPSRLREYLSFGAWREFGVAPRTGWADVTINGEVRGLYTVVEEVGGRFLEEHFPEYSEGDLYEPELPAGSLEDRGDDIDAYTNVGHRRVEGTDHATFLNFIDVLNNQDVSSFPTVMSLDGVLTYFAGNVALGNLDYYIGGVADYTGEAEFSGGENYFLYESAEGSFTLLPWDMNRSHDPRAVDPCGPGTNPQTGGYDFVLSERVLGESEHVGRYFETMNTILQGPGSVESLHQRVEDAEEVLGEHLDSAAVEELREAITARVEALLQALENADSCPLVVE